MPEISIMPEAFIIGGVNVGWSVVVAWAVIAVLTALLLIAQRFIRRMEKVPHGLQNLLELIVDGIDRFAQSKIGPVADFAAPIVLTFMVYIMGTTLVELFGITPATEDVNCTLALGLSAFVMVNVTAIKHRGLFGRLRSLTHPYAVALPIRVITDCISPLSMAIRLFSNVLAGSVIMKLLYAVVPVVVPAALSAYFTVLDTGIQTFVFGMLTLVYINEAIE
ncbi:MAG TPA: FoF1 ATP synthase subunit a [Clostridia bacterium]|nr:FoF1 ATP synthase subunit a [Clostridia bacterium]